jgi:hypothetical protein
MAALLVALAAGRSRRDRLSVRAIEDGGTTQPPEGARNAIDTVRVEAR